MKELYTRAQGFLWHSGAMILAFSVATLSENLGMLNLTEQQTIIAGLILGQLSKLLSNYINKPKVMTISDNGKSFIKAFESLHDGNKNTEILEAQQDPAGYWTIGWGNRFINGVPVNKSTRISRVEAETLFTQSLKEYEEAVRKAITRKMTQNEFDAMVSLCFNIGVTAFSNSLVAVKAQEKRLDREEMLRWKFAKSVILAGLVRRRNEEFDLYSKKN